MYKGEPLNVHASNKLSTGDVANFREAMALIARGMAAEAREWTSWNAGLGPDEQEHRLETKEFDHYAEVARKALSVYAEEVDAAEKRVIARLRALAALDGDDMDRIADALESGDYSGLAW